MAIIVVKIQVLFEECIEQNNMGCFLCLDKTSSEYTGNVDEMSTLLLLQLLHCFPSSQIRWFFKPAEKILDDISNCCSSTSKELTLEALSCWRMWIENQLVEDWKQNQTCYSAVRPLLTVKFHPLHKDDEVIEIKLSLMWLALNKVQHLIQLEGPQHILEVFIQSCLSWLSCSEDLLPETSNLILKLINSLYTKDVPNFDKKGNFPPLEVFVFQSNKLFTRLVPTFIEIFRNWDKIKEKTDLLCIWNHFLGHCERSFKFIPVSIWHKIFKLVENICGDEKETIENKLSVLHKCATSLKSVMYNSKFIDCSQLLTTPAEALLKLVIELSVNNAEENRSFEMFRYCKEISHVLSNQIVHTLGYESCIYVLPKLEEINSKSLHWGLWCGLANCFKDEMENVNFDQYNSLELKIFRKLRSVAVNFDLDRFHLEENSILMIQNQLNFLRIGTNCKDCSACTGKTTGLTLSQGNQYSHCGQDSPGTSCKEILYYEGCFSFSINNINRKHLIKSDRNEIHNLPLFSNSFERQRFQKGNEEVNILNEFDIIPWIWNSSDKRWLRCNFSFKNFNACSLLFVHTILNRRLIINGRKARRSFVFAPTYITVVLQDIVRKTRKNIDFSSNNLIQNVKKLQNKLDKCRFFTPIKLLVSLEGTEGVKFCRDFREYWEDIEEIVHDVDFGKNLKNLMTKNDNSIVCLCMFAFLVNFTFNLSLEYSENNSCACNKFYVRGGTVLSRKITNFTKKVMYHKKRLSKADFIENVSKILPRNNDNPLVLWSKNNTALGKKRDKQKKSCFQRVLNEDACCSVPNDLVIFKYFDELQNKFPNEINSPLTLNTRGRKRKYCLDETEKFSQKLTNAVNTVDASPRAVLACGKMWENKNVKVILAPPDVFQSLTFSELSSEILPKGRNTLDRSEEGSNYLLDKIECDGWNFSLEDESPTRKKTFCFDVKPDLKSSEVNKGEISVKCKTNKLANTSRKKKENLQLPGKEPYFLRRRPLKLPLKFKGEKNLNSRKPSGSSPKNKVNTPTNCNKFCGRKKTVEEVPRDNLDVTIISDSNCASVVHNVTKVDESFARENVHDSGSGSKFDVQNKMTESDIEAVDSDIVDVVYSIVEAVDKHELEDHKTGNGLSIKTELYADGECEIGAVSSPVTSKKRRATNINENVCVKKLKLESDTYEESSGDSDFKKIETKLEVCPDKDSADSDCGSKKIYADAENINKKSHTPVVQSRGSKMLALISESPKIERCYETSPSSKHQAVKPLVNKNSRASKMLALLPEIQEGWSNLEANHVEESGDKIREENVGREISGNTVGKAHHLTRNINNVVITGSPKLSPMRQRKSIRFDDDKNETVTYYTDSPPCLLRTCKKAEQMKS